MPRRPSLSALVALLLAAPLFAADQAGKIPALPTLPVAPLTTGAAAAGAALPGLTPLATLPVAPARVDAGLASVKLPVAAIAAPQAAVPPAAVASAAAKGGPQTLAATLGVQSGQIGKAIAADPSGMAAKDGLDTLYFGKGKKGRAPVDAGDSVTRAGLTIGPVGTRGEVDPASSAATFILNDERIPITGRAADYYLEAKRLEKVLKDKGVNLAESMDVMDDAYAEVYAKLKIIEAAGAARHIEEHNTHLPETLTWVDGFFEQDGVKTAVHTQRAFFHKASGPTKKSSEVAEGIRRIDKAIDQSLAYFAVGGKADVSFEGLDHVVLGFDTRGYKEIKDHVKAREAEIQAKHGDRFSFAFLDDGTTPPADQKALRAELTSLVKKYKGDGLQRIIEGVTYSRYTGLLLELKTIEHRVAEGGVILQSGRDLFDDNGMYVTEFDVVSRMPDGRIVMDEAKSARVPIGQNEALDDKFIYKLETYARNRALIEKRLGGTPEVVFSVDVGGIDRDEALAGRVVWQNDRQLQLVRFLQSKEKELSAKYGFKVSFLFLSSYPGVDPHLVMRWLELNDDASQDKTILAADQRELRLARKHGKGRR